MILMCIFIVSNAYVQTFPLLCYYCAAEYWLSCYLYFIDNACTVRTFLVATFWIFCCLSDQSTCVIHIAGTHMCTQKAFVAISFFRLNYLRHTLQPVMFRVMVSFCMRCGVLDTSHIKIMTTLKSVQTSISKLSLFCTYIRYWMYLRVAIDYHHPKGVHGTPIVLWYSAGINTYSWIYVIKMMQYNTKMNSNCTTWIGVN